MWCFRRPVSSLEILRSLSVAWHCERQNWCQGASNHWASQRFFFLMYMSTWHRVLPRAIIGKQNNHETPMALESQHEYIYIWYIIYNICYTYIYVIYVCCASQQGVGLLSRDFLVLLAWLSSSDSAWILRCFIWQMHVCRYYINIHTVTYVYSYNIYIYM